MYKDILPRSDFFSRNDYFDTLKKKKSTLKKNFFPLHFTFPALLILNLSTYLDNLLDNSAVLSSPCWASAFSSRN